MVLISPFKNKKLYFIQIQTFAVLDKSVAFITVLGSWWPVANKNHFAKMI